MIGGFGFRSFATFEEAERVAGFHIPRPSSNYPVGYNQTNLRDANSPNRRPLSTTQYIFVPLAPTSIGIDVAPASDWDVPAIESGTPTSIGAKHGWMTRQDNVAFVFAYVCGTVGNEDLWCFVRAPAEVGIDAFNEFVNSIS